MFLDRHDAGAQLAARLAERYTHENAVVYALPRGGVIVGHEIAEKLGLPLDIIITRKIGHPHNREYAIGAISEDGVYVPGAYDPAVDAVWLKAQKQTALDEAKRRRLAYMSSRASHAAHDKTAIIVDDGIATGLTMEAAVRSLRAQHPKKMVLAVPVAPHEILEVLGGLVDETVVLVDDHQYRGAVGAYYSSFSQVSDAEVIRLLTPDIHAASSENT